jgi:hypothetical protein
MSSIKKKDTMKASKIKYVPPAWDKFISTCRGQ